jgi:hypothetical protein
MKGPLKRLVHRIIPARALSARRRWVLYRESRRSVEEIFSRVYRKKLWGGELDFHSGYGSHIGPAVAVYVNALTVFLPPLGRPTVTDLGCGDFNIGSKIRHLCGTFNAVDVVPELIERNRRVFADMGVNFECLDATTDPLPESEVLLVRQVFQHLSNAQISSVLSKIGSYKWMIVTEHLPEGPFVPNVDNLTGAGIRFHGKPPSGVVLTERPFQLARKSERVLCECKAPEPGAVLRTISFELV